MLETLVPVIQGFVESLQQNLKTEGPKLFTNLEEGVA